MNWLKKIFRGITRGVRVEIDALPLFQEGSCEGSMWRSHDTDWSYIRKNDDASRFLAANRFIRLDDFLEWCRRNNINPWGK